MEPITPPLPIPEGDADTIPAPYPYGPTGQIGLPCLAIDATGTVRAATILNSAPKPTLWVFPTAAEAIGGAQAVVWDSVPHGRSLKPDERARCWDYYDRDF